MAIPDVVEKYLHAGQVGAGEMVLAEQLKTNSDEQLRFGLGILQFVSAVEHLGQALYRYGLRNRNAQLFNIPFLRLPVPLNPQPEQLSYEAARQIFQTVIVDLQKAETTLSVIQQEAIKLPLRLGATRLSLNGNGSSNQDLIALLKQYMRVPQRILKNKALLIAFDRGDVAWFRGYCHVLMALSEIILAHDWQELFERTAHIFFSNVATPHPFLADSQPGRGFLNLGDGLNLIDVITLVHTIHLPVQEANRLHNALTHLEQTLKLSKESWRFIMAETDDDHAWIPNPRQTGALGIRVTQAMVDSWLEFIAEAEAILAGQRLIPLWRGNNKNKQQGLNLRRVFTEPQPFDPIFWFQGSATTPYLEQGPLTQPDIWQQLLNTFGRNFIGFAIWFN